jgi:hypothetical protein
MHAGALSPADCGAISDTAIRSQLDRAPIQDCDCGDIGPPRAPIRTAQRRIGVFNDAARTAAAMMRSLAEIPAMRSTIQYDRPGPPVFIGARPLLWYSAPAAGPCLAWAAGWCLSPTPLRAIW